MTIACKISSGLDCPSCNEIRGKAGLFNELYLINWDDIDHTLGVNGITYSGSTPFPALAINMQAYAYAYKFCAKKGAIKLTHTLVKTEGGYAYYDQVLTGSFIQNDASARIALDALIGGQFLIVARDFNSLYWLIGISDGTELTAAVHDTGAAPGDVSGYSFTFTSAVDGLAPQLFVNSNSDTFNYLESLLA